MLLSGLFKLIGYLNPNFLIINNFLLLSLVFGPALLVTIILVFNKVFEFLITSKIKIYGANLKMEQVKKVVLAYSGGVDTSVCIPYLKNEYGISEVVTFVADLGQGEDLELIRQKALNSGASKSIIGNLVNSFVESYAFPAIRANALYLDKYPYLQLLLDL